MFQHTAARRRLAVYQGRIALSIRFNTQPPEGGWAVKTAFLCRFRCFNTQPPEGGWLSLVQVRLPHTRFQHTAARRRLGRRCRCSKAQPRFNTQPPEGGWLRRDRRIIRLGSFNTQPPEGGWPVKKGKPYVHRCFNTQPPEGGWSGIGSVGIVNSASFNTQPPEGGWQWHDDKGNWASIVSTHSRPKAAGFGL